MDQRLVKVSTCETLRYPCFHHVVDVGCRTVPFEDFARAKIADGDGAAEHPAVDAVVTATLVLHGVGVTGFEAVFPCLHDGF